MLTFNSNRVQSGDQSLVDISYFYISTDLRIGSFNKETIFVWLPLLFSFETLEVFFQNAVLRGKQLDTADVTTASSLNICFVL